MTTKIKKIIEMNRNGIAFVVGNGINRYLNNRDDLSWDDLLMQLWGKVPANKLAIKLNGVSLTEFYDILELKNTQNINLQKEAADLMADWKPSQHHIKITEKIKQVNAPILATNFEETFAKTFEYGLQRTKQEALTEVIL